ncbi:hypothetical protein FHR84_003544 [Actinopolyspora biskrensis]|uniref:DUF885 domain-containing protein n=1 Tax=Actinopolyspora biskrensis TaxID=1470178 RepID=A0A852Z4G0_9ACTN|nr:hypothetical protein [Actinopolyspora biskrensis]
MHHRALITEYLKLGLRFGRISPGFVHGYTGDSRLPAEVRAEPPPAYADLAAQARRLHRLVRSCELGTARREFLLGQLAALDCAARVLAGERIPFGARLRLCFQTEAATGDGDGYERAHSELDGVLPPGGSLAERMADFRKRDRIPRRLVPDCVRALAESLRVETRNRFGLPAHETATYRFVEDASFSGLQRCLGNRRSRVSISLAAPHRLGTLPRLLAHETYPGHHTQYCRAGFPEQAIALANTPQCVVAEGLAELGLDVLIGRGWGSWARRVLSGICGIPHGELAERVDDAQRKLAGVRRDAALMLHEHGADPARVRAYLRHWLLLDEDRCESLFRLLENPRAGAYSVLYPAGTDLVGSWVTAEGDAGRSRRYLRLLEEPFAPRTLRKGVAGQRIGPHGGS